MTSSGASIRPRPISGHVPQLVVLLERSALADLGRRRRRQGMIGGSDIDLADDAGAVLLPADIDHRGDQKNCGHRHAIDAAPRVQGRQAVGDQEDDQHADRRFRHRSLAAAQRNAAEHRGRQHDDFEADADVAADGTEPRRKEQRADAGQHAARDIAERDRPPHRDAGIVGRAARAADRRDVPSRAQPGHEDVAEYRDREVDQRHARNAEEIAAADEIP